MCFKLYCDHTIEGATAADNGVQIRNALVGVYQRTVAGADLPTTARRQGSFGVLRPILRAFVPASGGLTGFVCRLTFESYQLYRGFCRRQLRGVIAPSPSSTRSCKRIVFWRQREQAKNLKTWRGSTTNKWLAAPARESSVPRS